MMYHLLFLLILALHLLWDLVLSILAASQRGKPLPAEVSDIYDADDYARWLDYSAEKRTVGVIERVFDFAVLCGLFGTNILSGVYALLPGGGLVKSLLLLLMFTALTSILSVPFDWIRSIRIEGKYGFNKSTAGTFVRDEITDFLVSTVLNALLYFCVAFVYERYGVAGFWIIFLALSAFVLVFSMLATTFQRLYNKFTVLEDGELRDGLTALFRAAGYELENIYVMDASRRTTKVNAFCSGLGKFKKIVLYDNLVNHYTPREITAVFAHELGHYRRRDTLKSTAYSILLMAAVTGLIVWFAATPALSVEYGFDGVSVIFGLLAMQAVILGPVTTVLMIPRAAMARAFEYRADADAADAGCGEDLISALKKLSKDNFSDLNPHPALVALEYDHPTTADRIRAIRRREDA